MIRTRGSHVGAVWGPLAFVSAQCCHACEFSPQIGISVGTGAYLQLFLYFSELQGITSVGLNVSQCLETATWAALRRDGAALQADPELQLPASPREVSVHPWLNP